MLELGILQTVEETTMTAITEHGEDERVSKMSVERQFDVILTQTKCPHGVDECYKDVIGSQALTTLTDIRLLLHLLVTTTTTTTTTD